MPWRVKLSDLLGPTARSTSAASAKAKAAMTHGRRLPATTRAAVVSQPADAAEYLVATCRRSAGLRKDPVTVPSKAAEETQAMLAAKQLTPEQRAASEEARRRVMAGIRRVT